MFKKVGIVGSGLMGSGIAQVSAQAGFLTLNYDVSEAQLERAKNGVTSGLQKRVQKGKLTQEVVDATLERMSYTTNIEDMKECDVVIEAVFEDLKVKQDLFRQLDALLPEKTLIVTNTSALSITTLASVTNRADRVMGMHFFSPVPAMKLAELIRGLETSDDTYEKMREYGQQLKKVLVNAPDMPGFIVNRLQPLQGRVAAEVVEMGADPHDVDFTLKLGMKLPMGPFEVADLTGVDVLSGCLYAMYDGMDDERYRIPLLFKKQMAAGKLGRKTGEGFYVYPAK